MGEEIRKRDWREGLGREGSWGDLLGEEGHGRGVGKRGVQLGRGWKLGWGVRAVLGGGVKRGPKKPPSQEERENSEEEALCG